MLIEPKVTRVQKNFRLLPESVETIVELAGAYDSSESRVVEAILRTYGPALLRDAKKETKK